MLVPGSVQQIQLRMAKQIAVLLVFAAAALAQVLAAPGAAGPVPQYRNITVAKKLHLFDMYKLVLRSRGAYCMRNSCRKLFGDHPQLAYPALTIQTLATLQSNGSESPTSCMDLPFNATLIRRNVSDIARIWPSFDARLDDEAFWKEQALKYGSCAVCQDPLMNSSVSYFWHALDLYKVHDLESYFNAANIKPNVTAPIARKRFEIAFSSTDLNGKVAFHCAGKINNFDVLQEVVMCLNATSKNPAKCPKSENSTCTTEQVWYLGNLTVNAASFISANAIVVMATSLLAYFMSRTQ